jgi:FAD/FMN-containing dehydrogenase
MAEEADMRRQGFDDRVAIEGRIVERGDTEYERIRTGMVWNNVKPARHPDVIVQAASERDVPAAIRLARSRGLRVALRSGGHNWCGSSLRDGGLLLDLSGLRDCVVDPDTATATVGPGVTGSQLAPQLARYGLAFPSGHCRSVAVGGYLLSGGLGWDPGRWGPACAEVRGIEAVTADGTRIHCDLEEHADLFWAARGAGAGFFAAVTAFHLSLHPLPAAITTTSYVFPTAETAAVAHWTMDAAAALPPGVELGFVLAAAGRAAAAGQPVVTVTANAFADSTEQAARWLAPLRDCPFADRALARQIDQPTSMDALYEGSAALWPEDRRYAADTMWSRADLTTLLPPLAEAVATAPSADSLVLVPIAPASQDPALWRDMAFAPLGESYAVPYAIWTDPSADEANFRWLRETTDAIAPLATGHYIAEADLTAAPVRARNSYTPSAWQRLCALRAQYDPEGVFHSYLTP